MFKAPLNGRARGFRPASWFEATGSGNEFAAETFEGLTLVARLASVIGCDDGEAGGNVGGADGGFDLVAMLAAGPARSEGLKRDLAGEFIQVDRGVHGYSKPAFRRASAMEPPTSSTFCFSFDWNSAMSCCSASCSAAAWAARMESEMRCWTRSMS